MKLLHLTDTHLVTPGERLYGLDPFERLTQCIDDILAHHADAALCVVTGDLAHRGEPGAYEALAAELARMRDASARRGHVHRPVCGSWRGIPVSTMRGLNHQVPFDLKTVGRVPQSHEPPAYAVVFIDEDRVVVHFHDYLDRRTLVKVGDRHEYAV